MAHGCNHCLRVKGAGIFRIFFPSFFICTENELAHSPLFSSLDMILKNSLSCILAISNRKKIGDTHFNEEIKKK